MMHGPCLLLDESASSGSLTLFAINGRTLLGHMPLPPDVVTHGAWPLQRSCFAIRIGFLMDYMPFPPDVVKQLCACHARGFLRATLAVHV